MSILPFLPAYKLPEQPEQKRWLIEHIWTDEAVGIIGGEPKCCKSFLALTLAVSVASGTTCLGTYTTMRPGFVLLFAAEDALHVVKERLQGICLACGCELSSLPIIVITQPTLRLDIDTQFQRLRATVNKLKPRLLILDPFVRLHQIDENSSSEVATILGKLRSLQRLHHCSVILVHHAKKGATKKRGGQALRGSSEFHAWGDTNLYLRREHNQLFLNVEHRAERPISNVALTLNTDNQPFLQINSTTPLSPAISKTPTQKIISLLKEAAQPIKLKDIRERSKLRTATVSVVLNQLTKNNVVTHDKHGYLFLQHS